MLRADGVLEDCCFDERLIFMDRLGAAIAASSTSSVIFMVAGTMGLKLMRRNYVFDN